MINTEAGQQKQIQQHTAYYVKYTDMNTTSITALPTKTTTTMLLMMMMTMTVKSTTTATTTLAHKEIVQRL